MHEEMAVFICHLPKLANAFAKEKKRKRRKEKKKSKEVKENKKKDRPLRLCLSDQSLTQTHISTIRACAREESGGLDLIETNVPPVCYLKIY